MPLEGRPDMAALMRTVTDADVEAIKAAAAAMVEGKVAALRDDDRDRAAAKATEAREGLMSLSHAGAILFGDLADGISRVRDSVLQRALLAELREQVEQEDTHGVDRLADLLRRAAGGEQ